MSTPKHTGRTAWASTPGRFLGAWRLPSRNSHDVYLAIAPITGASTGLTCLWDREPPWPPAVAAIDLLTWRSRVFPRILAPVAQATGLRMLGVVL